MSVSARRVKDTTYFAVARVLIGPPEQTHAWLRAHYADADPVDPDVAASTLEYPTDEGTEWITVFEPVRSPSLTVGQLSTVAHESFHLTARILRNRGVTLTEESEEAYAYLLGSLFTQLAEARHAEAIRRRPTTKKKAKTRRQQQKRVRA